MEFYNGVGRIAILGENDSENYIIKYIDVDGNLLTDLGYDRGSSYGSGGYAVVRNFDEPGAKIIDKKGNMATGDYYFELQIYRSDRRLIIARNLGESTYFVLDENLAVILSGIDKLGKILRDSGSFHPSKLDVIWGDEKRFAYAKGDEFFIYDIKEARNAASFSNLESYLAAVSGWSQISGDLYSRPRFANGY
jgi:hypothetical protein